MSDVNLILGDCLEVMKTFDDNQFDAVITDPPYNIGKSAWDKIDNYLEWCDLWIAECSRLLKPNGAFWISHSKPLVLVKLSETVSKYGRGLINWITWDKYNGTDELKGFLDGFTLSGIVRSFQPMAEYLIYHADEGEWDSQCDKQRGFIFEPLRAYLEGERKRAGIEKADCNVACGFSHSAGGMASRHYFSKSQWCLPTAEHYKSLRKLFNRNGNKYLRREHDYLRREYDDLRREYEDLRYTFNNPGKMSSVWQIPPAKPNGHPTPKPEELLRRIIKATSNKGDIILDIFTGSGTTGVVCYELGRSFTGIEIDPKYFAIAKQRIEQAQREDAFLEGKLSK